MSYIIKQDDLGVWITYNPLEGLLDAYNKEFPPIPVTDERFPHECPKCSGPAYIGFSTVECKRGCR